MMNHKPPWWVGLLGIPRVYNNHHLWWGRSEIAIIYPDIYIYIYIYITYIYIYIYTFYIRITHIGKWYDGKNRCWFSLQCLNLTRLQLVHWVATSGAAETWKKPSMRHGCATRRCSSRWMRRLFNRHQDGWRDEKMVIFLVNIQKANWKPWPSRNSGFTHWKLWFSIVMVAYQRVAS